MKIYNYSGSRINENKYKDNPKLPKWPFRMGIIGGSACGKTNLLINLLKNSDGLKYDRLFLISPSLYQESYQRLIRDFEEKDNKKLVKMETDINTYNKRNGTKFTLSQLEDMEPDLFKPSLSLFDSIDEYSSNFNLDDCSSDERNLIVFDDVMLDNQSEIINIFSRGRHKNCSAIYLSQSFFKIPKNIRLNCSAYILFKLNSRELNEISSRIATDLEKKDFNALFKEATHKKYGFLVIDESNDDIYKIGF